MNELSELSDSYHVYERGSIKVCPACGLLHAGFNVEIGCWTRAWPPRKEIGTDAYLRVECRACGWAWLEFPNWKKQ